MPPPASLPLSQALRLHTRDLHRELDSTPRLRQLLSPDLTPAGYADCLQGLWLAHRQAEALLAPLDPTRPPGLAPYQSRLAALQHDLHALGHDPQAPLRDTSPESRTIWASPLGHYLGMRYVVEGASQGARLIGARLQKSIGVQGISLGYWEYQATLAENWQGFCACLDTVEAPDLRGGALAGAALTFHLFLAVFHEPSRQSARHVL